MELFTVNRYDATKLNEADERNQEEHILKQLQSRKEKKSKRASKLPVENDEVVGQNEEPPATRDSEEQADCTADPGIDENTLVPEVTDAQDKQETADDDETKENDTQVDGQTQQSEIDAKKLGDFIVLGGDKLHRPQKTDEVLPPWLSHPTVIESDLSTKGPSIKKQPYLEEVIKKNLKSMGFKQLFPVQHQVIPWILEAHRKPAPFWPRDVCISSPTGSGKTLAFAVPIVQLLLKRVAPAIRALIILPVQELAEQVHDVFKKLCAGTNLRPIVLSRKQSFHLEQTKLVECFNGEYIQKVDIVVTTAGRLVEHLHSTPGFTLRQLRFLIIDEADRVMNQIQNDWLYHLNKHVKQESDEYLLGHAAGQLSQTELFDRPRQPHKLLFSATLSRDPEKLQTFKLFHPKLFTAVPNMPMMMKPARPTNAKNSEQLRGKFIGQYTTPLELKELVCFTQYRIKPLTLFALIRENGYKKFLVFTNSIDAAHRLSFVLQRLFGTDLLIEEWSSSLTPTARRSVLSRFNLGKVNGIISTDALARGIDIDDIEVVISYDMPRHINTYIHRIGRTGRAGNRGTSIMMLIDEEKSKFNTLLKEAGKNELNAIDIKSSTEEEFAGTYLSALNDLRDALELEKQTIIKIRNGMTIANMTKLNLLSKLKERVKAGNENTTELIKSLPYVPQSWSNTSIEKKAGKEPGRKKRKLADTEKATNEKAEDPSLMQPEAKKNRWRNKTDNVELPTQLASTKAS
ncbi:probable ATP-dependent RNA helicase Dbp73D [Anopheles ziemanni]|uniref:probable ATP-dependent RNA helicase Dbp73D n=1 Tax=Anopheles coustani TaxID=139045 RepID=UPI00265929A3|nr:probable ATP-dependent RNA helicase Dbp73D [Anopheles coustani]XP_058177904.1 probable ATP-dependent RNA helicase Dbp73D [Anopheles ziemanni]